MEESGSTATLSSLISDRTLRPAPTRTNLSAQVPPTQNSAESHLPAPTDFRASDIYSVSELSSISTSPPADTVTWDTKLLPDTVHKPTRKKVQRKRWKDLHPVPFSAERDHTYIPPHQVPEELVRQDLLNMFLPREQMSKIRQLLIKYSSQPLKQKGKPRSICPSDIMKSQRMYSDFLKGILKKMYALRTQYEYVQSLNSDNKFTEETILTYPLPPFSSLAWLLAHELHYILGYPVADVYYHVASDQYILQMNYLGVVSSK